MTELPPLTEERLKGTSTALQGCYPHRQVQKAIS